MRYLLIVLLVCSSLCSASQVLIKKKSAGKAPVGGLQSPGKKPRLVQSPQMAPMPARFIPEVEDDRMIALEEPIQARDFFWSEFNMNHGEVCQALGGDVLYDEVPLFPELEFDEVPRKRGLEYTDDEDLQQEYGYDGDDAAQKPQKKKRLKLKISLKKVRLTQKAKASEQLLQEVKKKKPSVKVLTELVGKGADIHQTIKECQLVYYALKQNKMGLFTFLLDNGAHTKDLSKIEADRSNNLLHTAARLGKLEFCKVILRKRVCSIHDKGNKGMTALMLATGNNKYDVCEYLLKKGARVNDTMNNDCTALMNALSRVHTKIADLLLDRDDIVVTQK